MSDDAKSPLILEFEEFQRKLEAAARLTRSDFEREAKRIYDVAFFPYASKARSTEAAESHSLSIPDAEDPQARKSITGGTQRARTDGALWYYLEALLARMRSHIGRRFKPVAEIARRSSSADLLSSNLLFREALHGAPHHITTDQNSLRALCDFWGRPDWTASFDERFRLLFAEEWERLVCEAELEAPPLPTSQTMPAHGDGDVRSPSPTSETAGAVDEDESAAERQRKTQQIGDRVVSRQPPPGAQSEVDDRISEEIAWQVELGKNIHTWYTEMQRVQKLYPGGTNETTVRRAHPEFGFLGEIVEKLGEADRADFFARLHMLGAPELYDFIGRALRRSRDSVVGYVKQYRKSVKRLAN
jgi:hypothetical protein